MSYITPFNFEGAAVRALQLDGEPYFVGKDVAEALGYSDTTNAIKQHCKGVAKHHPLSTGGGMQEMRVLSEPDVLRLIVNSKLQAAVRFERWVFEDVLPSIRKTGGYSVNLADPAQLRQVLLGYTEKVIALESQVTVMKPKVEALNRIADAEGLLNPTGAAKALQVQPKRVFEYLRTNAWTYRRAGGRSDVAYQEKIAAGLLTHKVYIARREDGTEKVCEQVLVTPKGLAKLAEALSLKEAA